jgi:hypothetical protein
MLPTSVTELRTRFRMTARFLSMRWSRGELAMPPATIEMAKGFTLCMVMAIMSGRAPTGQKSSAGGEGPSLDRQRLGDAVHFKAMLEHGPGGPSRACNRDLGQLTAG